MITEDKPADPNEALPAGLSSLIEKLAEHVHDTWMEGRRREGWIYGKSRDDRLRTHPGMVPYEDLPDSEKEYDRRTALATIRAIHAFGYRIVPSEGLGPE